MKNDHDDPVSDFLINLHYSRQEHPSRFTKLPEQITRATLKQDSAGDFVIKFESSAVNQVRMIIKDSSMMIQLDSGFYLKTGVIDCLSTADNLWLFFVRYIDYIFTESTRWTQQEYVFTRDRHVAYFKHLDDSIHTVSIKSNPDNDKLIRVKYFKHNEAGAIDLRVDGNLIISTDRRYPYAFTFKGVHPKLEDVTRITANVIACMRAINEPPYRESIETTSSG